MPVQCSVLLSTRIIVSANLVKRINSNMIGCVDVYDCLVVIGIFVIVTF